jgi:uracil DNA glycosylase
MSSSSNRNRNRGDVLNSLTTEPYAEVQRLGQDPLHGPKRDQHIVFVLGVGPGLGLAVARVFAQQGYTVAIASRNKQRLDGWAKEVGVYALI